MTLNYPPLLLPCSLVSPQATVAALFVCRLTSPLCGGSSQPTTPESSVLFCFVNEKPVWVEVGSSSLRLNSKEYFQDIEGEPKHNSKERSL